MNKKSALKTLKSFVEDIDFLEQVYGISSTSQEIANAYHLMEESRYYPECPIVEDKLTNVPSFLKAMRKFEIDYIVLTASDKLTFDNMTMYELVLNNCKVINSAALVYNSERKTQFGVLVKINDE